MKFCYLVCKMFKNISPDLVRSGRTCPVRSGNSYAQSGRALEGGQCISILLDPYHSRYPDIYFRDTYFPKFQISIVDQKNFDQRNSFDQKSLELLGNNPGCWMIFDTRKYLREFCRLYLTENYIQFQPFDRNLGSRICRCPLGYLNVHQSICTEI